MTLTVAEKRARFAELHAGAECFVIPNPWDIGSTKYLASLGFKALATTSAGAAFAAGLPDGGMTRKAVLAHIAALVASTDVPFNADFEAGYATTREYLHESVVRCIATGVAGFSLEDYTGDPGAPFFSLEEAAERIRVARAAIDASGERVLLTARSETVLRGQPDGLNEALRRLAAYAEAGADVLYAPGLRSLEEVAEVVRVAGPLPVNVLASAPGLTLAELGDLGVRRISVGAALARVAWAGFMHAAQDIAQHGRFDSLAQGAPFADINKLFSGGSRLTAPPRRAGPGDVAAIEALQRAAYARNRVLLGVEPLPLRADYRDIVARMEVWLFGPPEAPGAACWRLKPSRRPC